MNKTAKKSIIWGTTAAAIAGITIGITVPAVNASKKVTNTSPIDMNEGDLAGGAIKNPTNDPNLSITNEQLLATVDNAGIKDTTLLTKLQYQLSFYLYSQEQEGSLKLQQMYFQWDLYSINKRVKNMFKNDIKWDAYDVKPADADKTAVKALVTDDTAAAALAHADGTKPYANKAAWDAAIDGAKTLDALKKLISDVTTPTLTAPTLTGTTDKALEYGKADGTKVSYDKISDVVLDSSKELFDALVAKAKAVIDEKLAAITGTTANDDAQKAVLNGYKTSLDSIKTEWTNKQKQIDSITNKTVNFDSNTFSTDYPKVLLPLKNIRDKQMKIFNETKATFMAGYSSQAEGNAEWQKQLSTKYNGATNDAQAIDYQVSQQVSAAAQNRYKFAVNKDFTFEQYKSNIFSDVLGKATLVANGNGIYDNATAQVVFRAADKSGNNADGKPFTKDDYQDSDKVYFFGALTKIPSQMNVSGTQANFDKVLPQTNIMQVQNAILGFKQGADKNSPWTITKEQLTKLFSAFAKDASTATRASEEWQNIFADKDQAGKDLTSTIISMFSDTTDATQWKSGNLGWQTEISALANYYEGFSLGIASALDDFAGGQNFGGAVDGHTSATPSNGNFLGDLMNKMREGLQALAKAKGWSTPTGATSDTDWKIKVNATPSEISNYNKEVAALLSTLSDSDIAQYFGKSVNEFFMGIKVDDHGVVSASGATALHGLPSTIRLDDKTTNTEGVFLVNTDQSAGGIHIIKIKTGNAAVDEMKNEFQEDANTKKQDSTKIITDWGKFVSDSFSQVKQFENILNFDSQAATPTNPSIKLKEIETILKNQYGDISFSMLDVMGYSALGWSRLDTDLTAYIKSQRNSEGLSRVVTSYRDGLFTWLEGKIDKHLWYEGIEDHHSSDWTITPDEIYGTLLAAEGIK